MGRVLIAAVVCLACVGCHPEVQDPEPTEVSLGVPLPPIEAEGWLVGNAPAPNDLEGKVIVVDCFASWCLPCAEISPELVRIYSDARRRGAMFIGLTPETADEVDNAEQFLREHEIRWPVGYGASETLAAMNIEFFPTLIVVARDGRIAWAGGGLQGFSEAVERELEKPAPTQ